jgi:hypothetical protein
LCIYLDPAREWNPKRGVTSAIDRLHDWLADAAAGRFDPDAALYHAVGGVIHHSDSTPTIVVRTSGQDVKAQRAFLAARSSHRHDLHYKRTSDDDHAIVVFNVSSPLPLGAGTTLGGLLARLDDNLPVGGAAREHEYPQSAVFLTALAAAATRNREHTPQHFVLTVPHPAGGPPHLLAGRVPPAVADELRCLTRRRRQPIPDIRPSMISPTAPLEWCSVSDERHSVTTRRDDTRPVNAFNGKTVQIWGCGGLGSWIAEFLARAGVKRLILCDPGAVSGGLLVRQNFTEVDVGAGKASALAKRVQALRDDIDVVGHDAMIPDTLNEDFSTTDVIIDATISRAIGQLLDEAATYNPRPVLAQVATDSATSTLGLLTVSHATCERGPNTMDEQTGPVVDGDGALEPFRTFWEDVAPQDELIPTRGCSVPTFHGSAADLAAVAASLVSILGLHLASSSPVSGTHLIALPHSPAGPFRKFIPVASQVRCKSADVGFLSLG